MPPCFRPVTVESPVLRTLTVARVTEVTPGHHQVTLTGEQLDGHAGDGVPSPRSRAPGVDGCVTVLVSGSGRDSRGAPSEVMVLTLPVSHIDLMRHELKVDVTGQRNTVVTRWIDGLRPGDIVHLVTPVETRQLPTGVDRFRALADILPPLALRAAANLGLGDLIAQGTESVADLVEKTGASSTGLRKLLRYLESIGVLESVSGPVEARTGYRLSPMGASLTDGGVLDHLRSDGVAAIKEQAFFGIEDAVRSGRPVLKQVTGRSWTQHRLIPDFESRRLDLVAADARRDGILLVASSAIRGARTVVIHSDGAGPLATALTGMLPEVTVLIPAMPTQASWLGRRLGEWIPDRTVRERISVIEQARYDPTPVADTIIVAGELVNHADADAVMFLRRAAGCLLPEGRILLIERTFDDKGSTASGRPGMVGLPGVPAVPDSASTAVDLLNMAVVASGYRTGAEVEALIMAAGLTVVGTESLGTIPMRVLRPR